MGQDYYVSGTILLLSFEGRWVKTIMWWRFEWVGGSRLLCGDVLSG